MSARPTGRRRAPPSPRRVVSLLAAFALAACAPARGLPAGGAADAGASAPPGAAASSGAPAPSAPADAYVAGSGDVELLVNGRSVTTASPGTVGASVAPLVEGAENVIAVRASRGASAVPYVVAEIGGRFGTAGTSARWRVKTSLAPAADDPAWTSASFDDSGWPAATLADAAAPPAFPQDGPARAAWSASPSDAAVLMRLVLYVPPALDARRPQGFGHQVTGGAGGEVVTVTTRDELAAALCDTRNGDTCADTTKRVILVPSIDFDFRGTEGSTVATACVVKACASGPSEYITGALGACDGKPTFPVTLDAAGNRPLLVGSNKTVLGLGAAATLRGKGLTLRGGVTNVIVQNVTIADINPQTVWGGDAITIDGASGVWIDHDRFVRIARQMVVTGFGRAADVTLSWNDFDGVTPYSATCDGTHYWVMLFLGAGDTLTVADNWIHDTSGRAPHAGGLSGADDTVHLVDNAYETVPGHALDSRSYGTVDAGAATTWAAHVLVEGNWLKDVATPLTSPPPATTGGTLTGAGYAYFPVGDVAAADSCSAVLGRPCAPNALVGSTTCACRLDRPALDRFAAVDRASLVAPFPATEVANVVPHLAGPGHVARPDR